MNKFVHRNTIRQCVTKTMTPFSNPSFYRMKKNEIHMPIHPYHSNVATYSTMGANRRLQKKRQEKYVESRGNEMKTQKGMNEFRQQIKKLPFLGGVVYHYIPGITQAPRFAKVVQFVESWVARLRFRFKFGVFRVHQGNLKKNVIPKVIEESVYTLPQQAPGSAYSLLSAKLLSQKYQLHRFNELPTDFIQDAKLVYCHMHRLEDIKQEYIQMTYKLSCKYPKSTNIGQKKSLTRREKRFERKLKQKKAEELAKAGIPVSPDQIVSQDDASLDHTNIKEDEIQTEYIVIEHSFTRDDAEWMFAGIVNHTKNPFTKIHVSNVALAPEDVDKQFINDQFTYYKSKRNLKRL
mmetsp:Transcript_5386/g.7935  ORF Transcript_5386/g.7935 Transcript_5386/m.7935 type:complete len:349 (-) Transcript_5386:37-1083(-)